MSASDKEPSDVEVDVNEQSSRQNQMKRGVIPVSQDTLNILEHEGWAAKKAKVDQRIEELRQEVRSMSEQIPKKNADIAQLIELGRQYQNLQTQEDLYHKKYV
jgi:hypothetical protein